MVPEAPTFYICVLQPLAHTYRREGVRTSYFDCTIDLVIAKFVSTVLIFIFLL